MELLSARRKLLEMAKRDIEHLRELRELSPDDCHQMVAVIADRLAHTVQVLEEDTDRLAEILRTRPNDGAAPPV
jgi:hypothetical protein